MSYEAMPASRWQIVMVGKISVQTVMKALCGNEGGICYSKKISRLVKIFSGIWNPSYCKV